jgi:flagellar basal body rod protein FlgC
MSKGEYKMNEIYNNTNYNNSTINTGQNIYQKNTNTLSQEITTNKTDKTESSDSIEINEKDEDVINAKKAYDAFKDTCSDFGYIETSNGNASDMSLWYGIVIDQMRDQGIYVPSFASGDKSGNGFLPFIDEVKEFAKNMNANTPGVLPDNFLDFCDAYKDKLIQYDGK